MWNVKFGTKIVQAERKCKLSLLKFALPRRSLSKAQPTIGNEERKCKLSLLKFALPRRSLSKAQPTIGNEERKCKLSLLKFALSKRRETLRTLKSLEALKTLRSLFPATSFRCNLWDCGRVISGVVAFELL